MRHVLLSVWLAVVPVFAAAEQAPFTIEDIRIEGLQTLSGETVRRYLPFEIGDTVTTAAIANAAHAIYQSGFFRHIDFRQEGNVLVVIVAERPIIEEISFSGNEMISDETLGAALNDFGLNRGSAYTDSALHSLKKQLQTIYHSNGLFNASVTTAVTSSLENRVAVSIDVVEGAQAVVRQVSIIGNRSFEESELRRLFSLNPGGLLSVIGSEKPFSDPQLASDLETLNSFYLDRGYAAFEIVSHQVATTAAKDAVFITVNIVEGNVYRFSGYKVTGDIPVPLAELNELVLVRPQQTFSDQLLIDSGHSMLQRLGWDGYARAIIDTELTLDPATRQVTVRFLVNAGSRILIRRIEFEGADRINDEVLRREMRVTEDAYLDPSAMEMSQQRLESLAYVKSVAIETRPVPGKNDLVDLIVTITQQPARHYQIGGGFTDSQRLNLNGYFINENLFGSGQRLALSAQATQFRSVFSVAHTDPYLTVNGLSREIALDVVDIDQLFDSSSALETDSAALSMAFNYRTSLFQALRLSATLQKAEVNTTSLGSLQLQDWVQNNGNPGMTMSGGLAFFETDYLALDLGGGWLFDSRNQAVFPDDGMRQQFRITTTVPGSEIEYFTVDYSIDTYWPLAGDWTLRARARLGWGDKYGSGTTTLPPYLYWFAGGPDTVRGFRENRLGPKDSLGNPYGGNFLLNSQVELMFPLPEKWQRRMRLGVFYDIGNVFSQDDTVFVDGAGSPLDYRFDAGEMKQSLGAFLDWRIGGIGTVRFSYGLPLNADDDNPNPFLRDEIDNFQVTIGVAF